MTKTFLQKLGVALPTGYFLLSDQMKGLVLSLFLLILLDTLMGVSIGFKFKNPESRKMRKFSEKVMNYSVTVVAFYIVSQMTLFGVSFSWIFEATVIFLIMTEFFSLTEKLAYLGVKLPMKILAKLNSDFGNIMSSVRNKEDLEKKWRSLNK